MATPQQGAGMGTNTTSLQSKSTLTSSVDRVQWNIDQLDDAQLRRRINQGHAVTGSRVFACFVWQR
jgi:hypothetical protein